MIIDPSRIQDPQLEVRILVFFPNHPSPDFSATARSLIAPSSTKIRPFTGVFVISESLDSKTIEKLIKKRNEARRNKNYALADSIREELKNNKIEIEDTKDGTIWRGIE